jgi:hypothetical protein
MCYSNVSNAMTGAGTVPVFLLNLAAHPLIQVGHREQDLPGHQERLERTLQMIGNRKWNEFNGASIVQKVEASRLKFSPVIFSLVLIVLGVTGTVFLKMLTSQPKL